MDMPVCRALVASAFALASFSVSAALHVAPGYHVRTAYTSAPFRLISALDAGAAGVVFVDGSNVVSVSAEPESFSLSIPLINYLPGTVPSGTDISTINQYGGAFFIGRGTSFSSPYPHALGVLSNGVYAEVTSLDGLYDSATDADGLGLALVGNPGFAGAQLFRFQPTSGAMTAVGTMGGYSGGVTFEPAISGALFYADQTLGQIWRFERSEVLAGGLTSSQAEVVVSNANAGYLCFDDKNRLLAVTDYGNALKAYDPDSGALLETVATDDAGGYGIGKVQGFIQKRRIGLVFSDFSTFSSKTVFLQPYLIGADYHGLRRATPAVYNEMRGRWRIVQPNGTTVVERAFGGPGEKAVGGDFDGDRRADLATCRTSDGRYRFLRSSDGSQGTITPSSPTANGEPAPGDFNADGLTDAGVFAAGSIKGQQNAGFPFSFNVPGATGPRTLQACGDFDGDGMTDPAVFIPSSGNWVWYSTFKHTYITVQWGWNATVPVPADYDGDGITDIAVYCPGEGRWYIRRSSSGQRDIVQFGSRLCAPVPGDFDGDGKDDIAVYVEFAGLWVVRGSAGTTLQFRCGGPGWKAVRP